MPLEWLCLHTPPHSLYDPHCCSCQCHQLQLIACRCWAQANQQATSQAIRPLTRRSRRSNPLRMADSNTHRLQQGEPSRAAESENDESANRIDGQQADEGQEESAQSGLAMQSLPQAWRQHVGRKVLWRKMPLPQDDIIPVPAGIEATWHSVITACCLHCIQAHAEACKFHVHTLAGLQVQCACMNVLAS